MTNKEAINIISQMIKDEEGFLSDNTVEAHKMSIKALEQTTWIPCSEQLPEANGRYLCTVGTNYRNPREMYYESKGKNNRTWASLDRAYVEDCFVIAWMPLPKPYEPQKGSNE